MTGSAQARIALNRFGLGARPGEIAALTDPLGWLVRQIATPAGAPLIPGIDGAALRVRTMPVGIAASDVVARATMTMASAVPFLERLALFWSNHFCVSYVHNNVGQVAIPYENEAIRPYVTGRFVDMLTATQRHAAMLWYLDLNCSTGPNSVTGHHGSRSFNENYAREVMELHTVGDWTQTDVDQLALALTGWSINRTTGNIDYSSAAHEPGARTLLGSTLAAGDGQASAAMAVLANHPLTRTNICTKLAAHFIADTPPASTVAAMVAAWGDGGNLQAIYRAMLSDAGAWQLMSQKFKAPQLFVISAARAVHAKAGTEKSLLTHMGNLGEKPFYAPSPAGYSDTVEDWLTPNGVLLRLDVAANIALMNQVTGKPADLMAELLAPDPSSHTPDAVGGAASRSEALALMLASPEFLRS